MHSARHLLLLGTVCFLLLQSASVHAGNNARLLEFVTHSFVDLPHLNNEPAVNDSSLQFGPVVLPASWIVNPTTQAFFQYGRFGVTGSGEQTTFSVVNETSLYAWGNTSMAGLAPLGSYLTDPVQVFSWPSDISALMTAATDTASFLLLSNGTIFSWGLNKRLPTYANPSEVTGTNPQPVLQGTPTQVDLSEVVAHGDRIVSISCKYDACVGVAETGRSLYVWGNWPTRQLTPTYVDLSTVLPSSNVTLLEMKGNHQNFVGLLSNSQQMLCWSSKSGDVSFPSTSKDLTVGQICGQTSLADTDNSLPTLLSATFPTISEFAVGAYHTIYLAKENGTIFGFGSCYQGNLGTCNNVAFSPSRTWFATYHPIIFSPAFPNQDWISVGTVGLSSFALNNQGYLYRWGADYITGAQTPPPGSQVPVALTTSTSQLPAGYRIQSLDSIVIQATHYYFTLTVQDLTPTCISTSPGPQFSCVNGEWVIYGVLSDGNGPVVISSPIVVIGNVSVTTGIQFNLPSSIGENDPLIKVVNGCVSLTGDLSIELTKEDLNSGSRRITLISSSDPTCSTDLSNSKTTANSPKSCKSVKVSTTTSQNSATTSLIATLQVDSSKCNVWWIILVSVLGGVVLIIVILVLLFTFNKTLKAKVRPFWVRSQPNGPPGS